MDLIFLLLLVLLFILLVIVLISLRLSTIIPDGVKGIADKLRDNIADFEF